MLEQALILFLFCYGVFVAVSPSPISCAGYYFFLTYISVVSHSGVRSTGPLLPSCKTPRALSLNQEPTVDHYSFGYVS